MDVRTITQQKLDNLLLPYGILSHHLRRVEVTSIDGLNVAVNNDEYVVFRIVSSKDGGYGDGNAQLTRCYIDVNYYYSYEKTDSRYVAADKRIKAIKAAFLSDTHFRVANAERDLPDIDNPYRGINIEFVYIGVVGNG